MRDKVNNGPDEKASEKTEKGATEADSQLKEAAMDASQPKEAAMDASQPKEAVIKTTFPLEDSDAESGDSNNNNKGTVPLASQKSLFSDHFISLYLF